MGDRLYSAIRWLGARFRYRVLGLEHLPEAGPAIYVANHRASAGPIQCILSLPIRLHPWIRSEMCRYDQAPAYLYGDFVATELRLQGWPGRALSWAICRVALPLIHGIGSVPVNPNNGFFDRSIALSSELLAKARNLLIFPEDRLQPIDEATQMRPFNPGFAWVSHLYARQTGRSVPVYPVALLPEHKTMQIGAPLAFGPQEGRKEEIRRFCTDVEARVRAMYTQLEREMFGAE